MKLKNQPRIGLELRTNRTTVFASVTVIIIAIAGFIYSNISSYSDSLANTHHSSNGLTEIDSSLPARVNYVFVKARWNHDRIDINWATSKEENNSHFVIEKTNNGSSWEVVDELDGAGNSIQKIDYKYTDNNPYPGVNFYRLKQVSYDQTFDYSNMVMVNKYVDVLKEPIKVYPNPADNMVFVENKKETTNQTVSIIDLQGKTILTNTIAQNGISKINLTTLKNGIYYVQYSSATGLETTPLVIRH